MGNILKVPKATTMQLDLSEAPKDVLLEIFMNLDPKFLIKNCTLVSKSWYHIINEDSFWLVRSSKENCREILPPRELVSLISKDYSLSKMYIKRPFNRNLIVNGSGEDGFNGWDITEARHFSENPFVVENPPNDIVPHDPSIRSCFATTYFVGTKKQVIRFEDLGFNDDFMAKFKPTIIVSEMHSYRRDAGAYYKLSVDLQNGRLGNNSEEHLLNNTHQQEFTYPQWTDPRWIKVEKEFKNYSDDTEQISFTSMGRDTMFWAGNYGSKMAKATILITFDFNKSV
uniref:F-box domain-containing protein n=1 Tax=Rhabditophanes sp. KR3021 TaxID=114890 RepID=A0AC35TNC4_9BILA